MKPLKASELTVHSDLSECAIEQAFSQIVFEPLKDVYLKVSAWDVMTATILMARLGSFQVLVDSGYSQDEWSLKCEDSEVWSPGA